MTSIKTAAYDVNLRAIYKRKLSQYSKPAWGIDNTVIIGEGDVKLHFVQIDSVSPSSF